MAKRSSTLERGIVSVLKTKTPSIAVGTAVIMFVFFTFYPTFSREVSEYLDFKKLTLEKQYLLEKDRALLDKESRDASLAALAEITINNSKALLEQAVEIGKLKGEVASLKQDLTQCRGALKECEKSCNKEE